MNISLAEGITLYRWLSSHGQWTTKLVDKLEKASEQQWALSYDAWLLGLYPCPLLGPDGLCVAYPVRPLRCRTLYAVSDPYYCHPHRIGEKTVLAPRDEVVKSFRTAEEAALLRVGVRVTEIPIGTACLVSAAVCKGTCDIGNVGFYIYKNYLEGKGP